MSAVRMQAVSALALLVAVLPASAVVLQPDEAASKDVFTYQFLSSFNFETAGPGFQSVLSAANTSSGHNTHTLIGFDLSSVPYTAAEVTQATLGLYVRDGSSVGFPFANPSVAAPVEIQAWPLAGAWAEATATWATEPGSTGSLAGSAVVSGINQWMEIDVTDLVKDWLAGSLSNEGLLLIQKDEVLSGGQRVATVFDSSSGSQHPYLAIAPEPLTAALLAVGAGLAMKRNRH